MIQNLVQERVDALAEALQRSVAVDDVDINLIAASRHFDDADAPRVRALLERTLDRTTAAYLLDHGISSTDDVVVRIEENPALELAPRSCYPIRIKSKTLGYVWLIGAPTAKEDEAAIACAKDLGVLLFGMQLESEKQDLQREAIVRDLFSVNAQRVGRAAYFLRKEELLKHGEKYRVLCVVAQTDDVRSAHAQYEVFKRRFNSMAMNQQGCQPLFTELTSELLVVLPSCCEGMLQQRELITATPLYVGIGKYVSALQCYESYMQAYNIVQVLRTIPTLGHAATWEDLGVYTHLALLFSEKYLTGSSEGLAIPHVQKLLAESEELLASLEVFLDNAGNIAQSSSILCIHRSSLYYRLKRIEEITGLSLDNGLHRLHLHLECKLWRMAHGSYG